MLLFHIYIYFFLQIRKSLLQCLPKGQTSLVTENRGNGEHRRLKRSVLGEAETFCWVVQGGGMEKPEMNLNIRNWDLQAELVSMPFGKGHNTCIYKRQVTEPENWFEVFERHYSIPDLWNAQRLIHWEIMWFPLARHTKEWLVTSTFDHNIQQPWKVSLVLRCEASWEFSELPSWAARLNFMCLFMHTFMPALMCCPWSSASSVVF